MDSVISFPPFLPLLLGGLCVPFLPLYGQRAIYLFAPIAAIMAVFSLNAESIFPVIIAGTTVHFLAVQEYSKLFGIAFCVVISAALLFGLRHVKKDEMAAALISSASGLGIVFAGDLLSLIFFWELLMGASVYLIFAGGMKQSHPAAKRYLILHILGGSFLLAGIAGTIADSGIAAFPAFQLFLVMPESTAEWSAWLILLGVMVNLAAIPFSAWLPDSYPSASPFGTIPLSTFTTKSALFIVMQMFVGSSPLIAIGLMMLFYGVFMALMNNHLRRHLCYCLVAQMGVMVMAVGIGNQAAMMGVAALAFCHIGYNALLMTAAGSIIRATGKHHLNDLGGLWRQMPITAGAIIVGALSMAALPFSGAYIGKHLIAEGLAATDHPFIFFLFMSGTAIAVYLLFPWFALAGKTKFLDAKEIKIEVQIAYVLCAALAFTPAVNPEILQNLLNHSNMVFHYEWLAIFKQFMLIAAASSAFLLLLPMLKSRKGIILDIDYLYRKVLPYFAILLQRLLQVLEAEWGKMKTQFSVWSKQNMDNITASARTPALYGISLNSSAIALLVLLLLCAALFA